MRAMPTGAKLVAGISVALVAFGAATLFLPALNSPSPPRWFASANAALGFVVGWRILGRMVGGSYRAAMSAGTGTSVWLFSWALLMFSLREMILRSLDKRYRTPTEALGNVVEIALYYAKLALSVEVVSALLLGGMIAGLLAEFANRRWD
ncbi:MAG: TrgA family protein [Alphaproteobacteria bacterium]|nr:TrgA family protein [Alphaproteobacteria bacterium]